MSGWSGPFARALADLERDSFPAFEAYWSDPAARVRMDAEIAEGRAQRNAAIDAGMEPLRLKQLRRWEAEARLSQEATDMGETM